MLVYVVFRFGSLSPEHFAGSGFSCHAFRLPHQIFRGVLSPNDSFISLKENDNSPFESCRLLLLKCAAGSMDIWQSVMVVQLLQLSWKQELSWDHQ